MKNVRTPQGGFFLTHTVDLRILKVHFLTGVTELVTFCLIFIMRV